jgi:outer membrane receptor protein involved in Fe transport
MAGETGKTRHGTFLRRSIYAGSVAVALACAHAAESQAQTALTGGVNGRVVDASGAALPGATVSIASAAADVTRETTSASDGSFAILGLTPSGDYVMRVTMPQFRDWLRADVVVASSASVTIDARLDVVPLSESVTVEGGTAATVPSPVIAQVIGARTIGSVPIVGRQTNRVALLDPHVRNTQGFGGDSFIATRLSINGSSFRDTHYRLDGDVNNDAYTNNAPMQPVSLGAVQEFKVLTNQYSAEFGGTSAGLLVLTTRSGSDALRGEVFGQGRPDSFSANPPLAVGEVGNRLFQSGFSVGGPIVRQRTFFFGSLEVARQTRGSIITSPAPATFNGELREHVGLGRIDHQLASSNTLTVRANGHRTTNTNPNDRVGGLMQPSTAQRSRISSVGVHASDRALLGRLLNEARVNYVDSHPSDTSPITPGVGVVRPGYSTEGFSATSTLQIRLYQASNQVSMQLGRHALRTGAELVHQRYTEFQNSAFGDYRFAPGPPTPGQLPLQYTQRFGTAEFRYRDTRAAAFVQDDWAVRPALTLNLGLRYEYQEAIGDGNNLAPRVGLVFDPTGTGRTVLRGGVGVFYDQAFQHGLLERFALEGPNAPTQTITLTPADAGFPAFPSSLPSSLTGIPDGAAPPRRNLYLIGEDVVNPMSTQVSFGLQHRLTPAWTGTVDIVHARTRDQFVATNANAPSPFPRTAAGQMRSVAEADATRPFATYQGVAARNVLVGGNGGRAYVDSIAVGLTGRFSSHYDLSAKYLYSRVEDSITDDHHGANPNEWSDIVDGERGPSEFSQPHRFVAFGRAELPGAVDVSGILTLASGVPINPLTGVDNNGDTTNTDRPVGFGRNAFRGPRHARVDLAATRRVTLARVRLEGRVELLNLLDASNYFRFNNVYGNGETPLPTFLQPVGGVGNVDQGRQVQVSVKLLF